MSARRAFIAGLVHETNSFSPIPTNAASFQADAFRPGPQYRPADSVDTLGYGVFAELCQAAGIDVRASLFASAQPSAPLVARDHASFKAEIIGDLERAMPVDVVFLFMHGAQIAEGCDDVEGDLAAAVRELVGPEVPIGIELDLHGNVSPRMLDAATLVLACLEYPHTDYAPRARQAFDILWATREGRCRPTTFAWRVPVVGAYPTVAEPMKSVVARLREAQGQPRVLALSVFHGFWLADTPFTGACVLATTDADPALARRIGEELAQSFIAAALSSPRGLGIEATLDAAEKERAYPVVIADQGDNAGGGAAGDSTFVLRAMLARGMREAAVALLWDPIAVDFAHRVGAGSRLALRLGGKVGPMSGEPLDVEAEVLCVREDARQAWFALGEPRAALGRSAALRVAGIDIVVNSERQQVFDPRVFTAHGIDPRKCKYVVVKSTAHFQNGFAPLAARILLCESPGSLTFDPAHLPYRKVPRPLYPIDVDFTPRPLPLPGRGQ